jgi:hypothetical protein
VRKRISIVQTNCKRCGRPIATASHSITGNEDLKAKFGGICQDCMTDDERHELECILLSRLTSAFEKA